MEAKIVYERLRSDFIDDKITDNWGFMSPNEFITEEFKKKQNGLVFDNSRIIKRVFIVTFPDEELLDSIINNNSDVLIFSHHPMNWSPSKKGIPFTDISNKQIISMKEKRISFFVLHSPLDKPGEYFTSGSFMQALRMKQMGEFLNHNGSNIGVTAFSDQSNLNDLVEHISSRVGHPIKLYGYGDKTISNNIIGIVSGGGNMPAAIEALTDIGVNTYVTGVTTVFDDYKPSKEFHDLAKKSKINVIGVTHYSSEKWACMNMLDYFRKVGLGCVFMPGKQNVNDL